MKDRILKQLTIVNVATTLMITLRCEESPLQMLSPSPDVRLPRRRPDGGMSVQLKKRGLNGAL
jgi:hypothetical protein